MKLQGLFSRIALASMVAGALSFTACAGDTGPAGATGPVGATGPAGATGAAGTDGTDGTNGTNGTNGHDGTNGTNGADGSSCSVHDNGNGTKTISCTDGTSATVADGTNGQDGQDGTNGTNGADGSSCSVHDNGNGTKTISCTDGTSATVSDGAPGKDGGNVQIANFHGEDHMKASGEYAAGKYLVNAQITSATADAAGVVTVNFTVATKDATPAPVTNLTAVSAIIVKLAPPAADEVSTKWVSYIWSQETAGTGEWNNAPYNTPATNVTYRQARESSGTGATNGTLTNHNDGSYTYVFRTNISNVTVNGAAITYERNRLHRVSIMMGGHAGPTADAFLDFVPDGSTPATAAEAGRDIVRTNVCLDCHGWDFKGHGGDRLTVENCVTCHAPGGVDAQSGNTIDLKVMIHKIHAGGELPSIAGPDGFVWDDPATAADESADNGHYTIWGNRNSKHEWWKAGFPAMLANCQKCHNGTQPQVDNWKTKPSRAVCGSCHDNVNFTTGDGHQGGPQTDDNGCRTCHPATGTPSGIIAPVTQSHDWTVKDPRNIPEYDGTVTISTPANGQYFVAGEAPIATIVLRDHTTHAVIDHTTVVEDASAEGCLATGCPPADGGFNKASFFVSGPRARRAPVLTTTARAELIASGSGPWDLSASGASLTLTVDGGKNTVTFDSSGADFTWPGTFTVNVSAGTFANTAAATPAEVIAWLNGNSNFSHRAIAYIDEATGRLAIRSRNLGDVYSIAASAGAVTTAIFNGDTAVKLIGGFTAPVTLSARTNPANNDPKVTRTAGSITYQMDPVDDLKPGTYVASIEMGDRGRVSATNYKTPTVAWVTFQVKQAAEEAPIARNCNACHQGPDGRGFILDYSRHNKKFGDVAPDQCGACHDWQPQTAAGDFSGARTIVRRVHSVHKGSKLVYPEATVGYVDTIPGRRWDIEFPQDIRNCQSCHPADTNPANTTSGSWLTKPGRLACGGCHDKDAATAHMAVSTFDVTPANPFSGDEVEACSTCH